MSNDRRHRIPGGTYFFTVNLLDRNSRLLVEPIDVLPDAVRTVRARAPFPIDAWVVLPEHLHCIWTLPPDDTDYSGRGLYPADWSMSRTGPAEWGERRDRAVRVALAGFTRPP